MKVLVLNCGSSSLKYQMLDMSDQSVIAKGQVELDEYDLEQWKNYLNGEISASDYMSHVIKMVGAMKNTEEQVQQDIDGTKK